MTSGQSKAENSEVALCHLYFSPR